MIHDARQLVEHKCRQLPSRWWMVRELCERRGCIVILTKFG